jgi:hypothetical protein
MEQKICFSKKIGFLTSAGIIAVVLVGLLNLLTQQQTNTNSKAAEVKKGTVSALPPAHACNTPESVVVKDMNGTLWSWGSVTTIKNGVTYCSSEQLLSKKAATVLYPLDMKPRLMEQYEMRGSICVRYGVDIDITSNYHENLYAAFNVAEHPEYLTQVPGYLVATNTNPKKAGIPIADFFTKTKCSAAGLNPICQERLVSIGTEIWNVASILCTSVAPSGEIKKGCCSTLRPIERRQQTAL